MKPKIKLCWSRATLSPDKKLQIMFDANIFYVQCQCFQKFTISVLGNYCVIKFEER